MLIAQGIKQFEIWTGQEAPADLMREKVTERLFTIPEVIKRYCKKCPKKLGNRTREFLIKKVISETWLFFEI